jgi:hypothetical protein
MNRICYTLLILGLLISPIAHAEETSTVGDRLELGFYSRIHENSDKTIDILRKKQLSSFKTFAGYGSACRNPLAWLDIEPMNEWVLRALTYGDLTPLSQFMAKNKSLGVSDSVTFQNAATCLTDTYRNMDELAAQSEERASKMGLIGLYTDGDTANSDYDILSDIERINSILFTQKLDYIGKKNMSLDSLMKLMRGEDVGSLFGDTSTVGASAASIAEAAASTTSPVTAVPTTVAPTLVTLGVGWVCSVPGGSTPVGNLTDGNFADDLSAVLAGGNPPLAWSAYGWAGSNTTASPPVETSASDYYSKLPCSDSFCVKVTMVPGQMNLLGGGKSYSIESLLDRHAAIMNPISNSNLGCQVHSKNSYENKSKGTQFATILGGIKVYVQQRGPQEVKKIEKEDTKEERDAQFESMRRCAYVSAGLPSDSRRANITSGAGYQWGIEFKNTENKQSTEMNLWVINPEDTAMRGCMDIALGKARTNYYAGFATDLTELEVFTTSLTNIIEKAIYEHTLLDKKPIDTCNAK